MKIIHTLFYFFGSIYLALMLIALLALYVIIGTFLESFSGSHLYAAAYTYHSPLFNVILGLFFVNILFSALRRWPFKKRHIPFLITHLGLLMILSGVILKNRYGVQGNLHLNEGEGSVWIDLPHSHSIAMVDRQGKRYQHPTETPSDLNITVTAHSPHVKEEWLSWVKGRFAYIMGMAPIEVINWSAGDLWPASSSEKRSDWSVLALNTPDIEEALHLGRLDSINNPLLLITQDPHHASTLWAFPGDGRIFTQSFKKESLNSLLIYDEGYSGYGVQAYLPSINHLKIDTLLPPIAAFRKACQESAMNFPSALLRFLRDEKIDPILLNAFDGSSIPVRDQKGCYWASLLLNRLFAAMERGEDPSSYLKNNGWPLPIPKADDFSSFYSEIAKQMFSTTPYLPEKEIVYPKSNEEKQLWLSVYFKGYGVEGQSLLPDFIPLPSKGNLLIETTIQPHFYPVEPSNKWEENRSGITLLVKKGERREVLSLGHEELESRIKWPVLGGEYLMSFQLERLAIPYHVELKEARQINYPHSDQPYSYESDVAINGVEATLSMNHVYETWDGYRFYLSGISVAEDRAIKRVQIVVNHDPAKYILTYPGAILVALGSILLFWMMPYIKD
jgi:hypothetical protein